MTINDLLTTTAAPPSVEPVAKSAPHFVEEPATRVLPVSKRAKTQRGDRGHRIHSDHGHGDRGNADDTDVKPSILPVYVRYRDLQAAGLVNSWNQLANMVDNEGFPPGVLLSPNIRAWRLADIESWLATRPTARRPAHEKKA
jgi:hypothetical protein